MCVADVTGATGDSGSRSAPALLAKPFETISHWAARTPDAVALHFGGRATSYRELRDRIELLRRELGTIGLRRGDRCGLALANSDHYFTLFFALQKAGCCPVLISETSTPAELARSASLAGLRALFLDRPQALLAAPEASALPATPLRWLLELKDGLPAIAHELPNSSAAEPSPSEHALISYTSGTSGNSKAVVITYEGIGGGVATCIEQLAIDATDRRLTSAAISFTPTILLSLAAFGAGASVYVLRAPFLSDIVLDAIEKHGITLLTGTPFLYQGLLQRGAGERYSCATLRKGTIGSAMLQDEVRDAWRAKIPWMKIYPLYALSETFCPVLMVRSERALAKNGCIGTPVPGIRTRISSEGELLLRLPYPMGGYFNAPELNQERFDSEGWFHTGDLFAVDAEGDYFFRGIRSDVINYAGLKVAPAEVEKVISAIPGVINSKVFGFADPSVGERVVAGVRAGAGVTEADIIRACREKLSPHKVPSEIVLVDEGDLTSTQKIRKQKVIAKLEARRAARERPGRPD